MYRDALDARSKLKAEKEGRGFSPSACPVLDQMIERSRVMIGEINAGNTSVNLRSKLSRILLTLYKNKRISKEEYRRFATM